VKNNMKKITGYIVSNTLFYIGDLFCRISLVRNRRGEYFFDKTPFRQRIGMSIAGGYQNLMSASYRVQEWAGNENPWKKVDGK
jgi:hypothetical protein